MSGGKDSKGLQEFLGEAQDIVDELGRVLMEMDRSLAPGQPPEPHLVNAAFRSVHTLKGLSGLFGVASMAVGVGGGVASLTAVGSVGVASSGWRQAASNTSSSKHHNKPLAFIALSSCCLGRGGQRPLPLQRPPVVETIDLFYIGLPCLASGPQRSDV